MKISNRDKKLLVYLLAICIVAATYFFVASPLLEKQEALTNEITNLQIQVNHCTEIYNNRENYQTRTAEAQREYNEIANKFFGGLDQENVIMMVKGLEESTGTWISRISFSEVEMMTGSDGEMTEVSDEVATDIENSSDDVALTGLRQDLNIDYSAKYEDFKKFVEYVQNYDKRLYISSMSASYVADANKVTGSIVLSQYAINGIDKDYKRPDVSIGTGVDNIFSTLNSTSSSDNALTMQTLEKSGEEVNREDTNSEEIATDDTSEDTAEGVSEPEGLDGEASESEGIDDSDNSGRRRPGA